MRNKWRTNHTRKLLPSVLVLSIAVVAAAARPPLVLSLCVGLAACGLLINKPPKKKSLFFLWWTGIVFFAWNLFTLLPLPIQILGQPRVEFFQQSHYKLAELKEIIDGSSESRSTAAVTDDIINDDSDSEGGKYGSLTLNQAGTRRFVLILAGAWAMFWLSTAMTLSQRLRLLSFLVFIGTATAVLGLAGYFLIPSDGRVWWFIPVDYQMGVGPFINRNHFASFCALLAPVALSLLVDPFSHVTRGAKGKRNSRGSGISRIESNDNDWVESSSSWKRLPHSSKSHYSRQRGNKLSQLSRWHFIYAFCFVVLALAPILIISRGGMVAMLLGCFTVSLFWLRGRPMPAVTVVVVMIGLFFTILFWPSAEMQERVATLRELQHASPRRTLMSLKAIDQWRDFPLMGGGADSFRTVSGLYKKTPSSTLPLYSENEYAQLLADHGLLGALFVLTISGAFAVAFLSNFRGRYQNSRSLRALRGTRWRDYDKREDQHESHAPMVSLPVLAAVAGMLVGMLFHSACDFPLRVPLNAFVVGSILGMVMPLPIITSPERSRYWRRPFAIFIPVVMVLLLTWSGEKIQLDETAYLRQADVESLSKAVSAAPSYWVAWLYLSERTREKALGQLRGEGISVLDRFDPFRLYEFAVECLEITTDLNPLNPRLWLSLARVRLQEESEESAAKAHDAFYMACRLSPTRLSLWREWLSWNLSGSDKERIWQVGETSLQDAVPEVAVRIVGDIRNWAQEQGLKKQEYRAVVMLLELQPERTTWWEERARLEEDEATHEEAIRSRRRLAELRPEDWQNWLALGKLLLQNNENEAANRAFSRAISLRPQLRDEVDRVWRRKQMGN